MCPHNIFFTIGHPSFCLLCTDIYTICVLTTSFLQLDILLSVCFVQIYTISVLTTSFLQLDILLFVCFVQIYTISVLTTSFLQLDILLFVFFVPIYTISVLTTSFLQLDILFSVCFVQIYTICVLTTSFLQLDIHLFVFFVQIHGSLAAIDGRLKMDDRVLEINGQDVSYGTQEQAAALIVASAARVQFVVARRSRPQTPDIIRSASGESSCGGSDLAGSKYSVFTHSDDQEKPVSPLLFICQEKIVTIHKVWVCFRACVSIRHWISFRISTLVKPVFCVSIVSLFKL